MNHYLKKFNGKCIKKYRSNHKFDIMLNLLNGKKCLLKCRHQNYMSCATCLGFILKFTCFEGKMRFYHFDSPEDHDCMNNLKYVTMLNLKKQLIKPEINQKKKVGRKPKAKAKVKGEAKGKAKGNGKGKKTVKRVVLSKVKLKY